MSIAIVGLLIVIAGGLSSFAIGPTAAKERETVIVGSKPFTEQYILSHLIGLVLEKNDFNVDSRGSMGSTILFDALKNNNITCYVDYSGTLWANVMKRKDKQPSQKVLYELTDWLKKEHDILCLGALGFENTYALAVKKKLADSLNLKTIADLSKFSSNLTIGSDYEFFSRPEWFAIRDTYQLNFKRTISMDPALMYSAIEQNQIQVVTAYSTDGRIVANNLTVLEDPKQALPPYDAVLLLSPNASKSSEIINALNSIIGVINNNKMQTANMRVDIEKAAVSTAANELLKNLSK